MTSLLNTLKANLTGQELFLWQNIAITLPADIQNTINAIFVKNPSQIARITDALRRKAKSIVVNNQAGYQRANDALIDALLAEQK